MNISERLQSLLDPASVIVRGDGRLNAAEFDDRGRDRTPEFQERANFDILVEPADTAAVQKLVRFAREAGLVLVPSGGRTGLAGGAVATAGEIVVSLRRMNRLLEFLPGLPALRVEAGMIVGDLHRAAGERDLYFPVDWAAAGSAQVGGMIATNAGGQRVIRYGTTREQVLGLKAISGTGELLEFPGGLIKNNTGYDLKQLLIGSEGTLAIVTEATLRLRAPPGPGETGLLALADFAGVTECLAAARANGLDLHAFECFDEECLRTTRDHLELPAPFARPAPWFVLIEAATDPERFPDGLPEFVATLDQRKRAGKSAVLIDAIFADSARARDRLWSYREGISESLGELGPVHKNDVALPVHKLEEFLNQLARGADFAANNAASRLAVFGHVGDGNLHLNWMGPAGTPAEEFFSQARARDQATYALVRELGGSISAEHGIGLLKKDHLAFSRSGVEIELMRAIKAAFDPDGILNPGKVLPDREG